MQEELGVALGARRIGQEHGLGQQTGGDGGLCDFGERALPNLRGANHAAALRRLPPAGFELRLHQHQQVAAGQHEGGEPPHHQAQADERQVDGHEIRRAAGVARLQVTDVGAFEAAHVRGRQQPLVQLRPADVDGHHARRAVLEEAVGEPAGGGPHVDAALGVHLEVQRRQRPVELVSPAAHETRALQHLEGVAGEHGPGGPLGDGSVDGDGTGVDEPLRFLPARRQLPAHQLGVESAPPGGVHRVDRLLDSGLRRNDGGGSRNDRQQGARH